MNESEFHRRADDTLNALADALEEADARGALEVEYQAGIMTIELSSGTSYIISKHAPSQELWLSSPRSGGLHFHYADGEWKLADGRTLEGILSQELGMTL
ncbi:MAG: iron donor protein CyaY [Pseudomonadota bacterium]|nr:iron donor protein CyaY [Pseudomonadota bacterium]